MTNTLTVPILPNIQKALLGCIGNLASYNSTTEMLNHAQICVAAQQNAYNVPNFFRQGKLIETGNVFDLALKGPGLLVVNDTYNSALTLLTRSTSLHINQNGLLSTAHGYLVQGNDNQGNFGNIDLAHISNFTHNQATTNVKISANLDANQPIAPGAGEVIQFQFGAINNYGISNIDVIANENNGNYAINSGDYFTLTSSMLNTAYRYTYGSYKSNDITTNLLGANTVNAVFGGASDSWSFQITSQQYPKPANFFFLTTSPNTSAGQFNNLATLAVAINNTIGYSARIVGNYLYLFPQDATQSWALTDVAPGTFVASLFNGAGTPAVSSISALSTRFSNLNGLSNLINANPDIKSILGENYLSFYVVDATATITVAGSNARILQELGLNPISPTVFGPQYDMSGVSANNMASGRIIPHNQIFFSLFDSIGSSYNTSLSLLKTAQSTWSTEIYTGSTTLGRGYIVFNGDGSLNSVSNSLLTLTINWANGALQSVIAMNYGVAGNYPSGSKSGISQLSSPYVINYIKQDGLGVGNLAGFTIDKSGNINGSYSNGASINLYTIPLATCTNMFGLVYYDNNTYSYDAAHAGMLNMSSANNGLMGAIYSGYLEDVSV